MGSIVLDIKYTADEGLVMSPSELIEQFLFGINLCTPNGLVISAQSILQKIKYAQSQIEKTLSIVLERQVRRENRDFNRVEFQSWGFVKTTYQVNKPLALYGYLGTVRQIEYPGDWLSVKRANSEWQLFRQIFLVPNGTSGARTNSVAYVGISPTLGYFGSDIIPNYWTVTYLTGYKSMPPDIFQYIGMLAAVQILSQLNNTLLGAGITSESISVDGISQSITTTRNQKYGIYNATIQTYLDTMKDQLPILIDIYRGLLFDTM